ncbi:hypothetical protein SGFS_024420 [Streptomyces graminofaciens]|uniref:Uncharacterized protein n=1 Tax=Streptomyces graminofaciens TaxID=68212 RepID=A0ABM7F5R6_9ACTN|nr:hypothetical protein SGFS_024420 [Streptomyces graminofaciens]
MDRELDTCTSPVVSVTQTASDEKSEAEGRAPTALAQRRSAVSRYEPEGKRYEDTPSE